jgi:hypothetical protein
VCFWRSESNSTALLELILDLVEAGLDAGRVFLAARRAGRAERQGVIAKA